MSRLYRPGDSYNTSFVVTSATGAAANADSTPTGSLLQNGAADGAVTVTVTNPATGQYKAACTIPGGYAAGDVVELLIAATVGTVATKAVVDKIRLVQWPPTALPNAAAGANGGVPTGDASARVTLAPAGLDAISITDVTTDAGIRANFRTMMRGVFNRFFNEVDETNSSMTVKNDSGTVTSTMSVSDNGTTAVKGKSS